MCMPRVAEPAVQRGPATMLATARSRTEVAAYALFTFGRRLLAHEMAWRGGGHWRAAGTLAVAAPYELCRSSWHA